MDTYEDDPAWEIQLTDKYEDEDFKIYFDKASIAAHLTHLQDDNLLKIHYLQEDQLNLEKVQKKSDFAMSQMKKQILEV